MIYNIWEADLCSFKSSMVYILRRVRDREGERASERALRI